MKYKKIIKIILLTFVGISTAYLIVSSLRNSDAENKLEANSTSTKIEVRDGYTAYYFHTTARCYTCKLIEKYANETIKSNFLKELDTGKLKWKVINVENPGNKHFITDFKLHTKSLVVTLTEKGKVIKWKNLEDVWKYARNEQQYKKYVKTEITKFME
jgi:hypothetical protein